MKNFFSHKNNDGLSLIELVVSIFIITMITGLFLANYHSAKLRNELLNTANLISGNIRTAQNNSLGMVKYSSSQPAVSWGVNFQTASPNQFIVFADINGNNVYNAGEAQNTQTLPAGIRISSLRAGTPLTGTSPVNIIFQPPNPKTIINNQDYSAAQITIIDTKSGQTKNIDVNFFGLIDVN